VGGAERPVVYKRFRVTSQADPWLSLLRPTAAHRSWVNGQGLWERDLPTPRPLAVLHRGGLLAREGYLLTEKVPDALDLHAFVRGLGPPERQVGLRRLIEQVARLVRDLHRRRLSHRDLKAANLLVNPERVWFVDLVGVRRHRRLARGRRVQNLARLNASFLHHGGLTRTDRLRFLRDYLRGGFHDWKRWWQAIGAATLAKVARNERTGRPLA
jgi:hypothetical protein